jgi:hypothetical protein
MKNIRVSYIKMSHGCRITQYNQKFIDFFGLDPTQNFLDRDLRDVLSSFDLAENLQLCDICEGDKKSLLVFRNHCVEQIKKPVVSIIYVSVHKTADSIIIKMVNWLNWIKQLNSSLENGYNLIANMDDTHSEKITKLYEIYWFKALLPLLLHIPNGFVGMVSASSFFDILKLFTNKRGKNVYSKDYGRDLLSRIRGCIRRSGGADGNISIGDIIKKDSLINLNYVDELFIPYCGLEEDIVLTVKPDIFLGGYLDLCAATEPIFQ